MRSVFVACCFGSALFSVGCDLTQTSSSRVETETGVEERETSCVNGKCTGRSLDAALKPLPPDLSAGVRKLGEGLPLAVTPAAYERLVKATRVVPKGKFTSSVGPAAVQAQFDAGRLSQSFELLVMVGPLPNVEAASQSLVSKFVVSVREVMDARGRNVLDETSHQNDAGFVGLRLAAEPPVEYSAHVPPRASLDVAGYKLSNQAPVTYGQRAIPLSELVAARDIRGIAGSLTLKVPLGVATALLEGSNVNRSTAKYTITGGVKPDDSKKIAFSVPRGAELYVDHVALSSEGKVLEPKSVFLSVPDGTTILHVTGEYSTQVGSVRVAMAESVATIEENFSLSP